MNFVVLILILLLFLYVKLNFKNIYIQGSLIKIICKTSLSKENCILIIKIMDKYYLCSSTPNEFKIIEHLDENQVCEHLNSKRMTLLKKE